jgi:hypothetical protein
MANEKQDELDRILDAALEKYAAAVPRRGLEDRVLANLRAERVRVPEQAWWRWGAIAALAAMVIVTATLAWRSGKPSHPVAHHPAGTVQGPAAPATPLVSNRDGNRTGSRERRPMHETAGRHIHPSVAIALNPRLDQFPSPQPLSEQEKFLQNYIAEYPEKAVLIARARSEELRRYRLEEMQAFPSGDLPMDSEERNNGTTER